MKTNNFLFLLFSLLIFNACEMPKNPEKSQSEVTTKSNNSSLLFVGTYTRKEGHVDGKAEGVYILKMDNETGELTAIDTIRDQVNPSYLTIHPNGKYIYVANELADADPENIGTLSAFSFDKSTNKAQFLNSVSSGGDAPCHVSVDASGKFVLVANYVGGVVASFPILDDGKLGEAASIQKHKIEKVNLPRQEDAHAHMIVPGLEENSVYAADLGTDEVIQYNLDDNGKLEKKGAISTRAGAGPRHIAFHPSKQWMYVLTELNYSIEVFKYENNQFEHFQNIRTVLSLDNDEVVNPAAIKVHPNGRFLYASNRGLNGYEEQSIGIYKIDSTTGKLDLVRNQNTKGQIPRDFEIDPSGKFLLVANQNSDSIVTFRINSETGMLEETGIIKEVKTPVCLKFML